jgi:transcription elongation GreA/GreB family factor
MTHLGRAVLQERRSVATAAGDTTVAAAIEKLLAAGAIAPPVDPLVAGLGAEVTVRDARGRERVVRLVTSGEVGLVDHGATPASPMGAAVIGGRVGDVVEIEGGGAAGEVTITRIAWPDRAG